MAQGKISFIIKKDEYADIHRKYILCVKRGSVTLEAPRFGSLTDALCEIEGYVGEFPLNKNFKIDIQL